ncbi:CTP synthase [Neoactinobaculum massilliense]|uniref:CTP synthase n=1 Tax=Neoactinobaculum massilliense TaxID=2364794 RepID=UPI000F53D52A|nr:CTP synthase [Neoactinobaculum massilliense]
MSTNDTGAGAPADTTKVTKHVFITGGVVSSLGKGITASSLGHLLRARGFNVVMQKLDPYINVDPGTMNPFQHGEVFVTDDGAETDLDIGHYERFLDVSLSGAANATTGQVYSEVIRKEREGKFLGQTVQVIPHITNEIIRRMRAQAAPNVDIIITEIGGTVGDIESQPFLEAARQVRARLGRGNVAFVHVSLVPYLRSAGELKTKPTQHSVAALRSIGITPDALVCRAEMSIPASMKEKISLMTGVDHVVECPDADSIYKVPMVLHAQGLDEFVVRTLSLDPGEADLSQWKRLLDRVENPNGEVEIALVGKYVDLHDAYLSVGEAIRAGGFGEHVRTRIRWVAADRCATLEGAAEALAGVDGIVVPGGFGIRGIEGKIGAVQFARIHRLPTLGICLGLQVMVIEAARNLLGLTQANSTEFDAGTPDPVVATMDEQKQIVSGEGDLGGTMRLGAYPAVLAEGSLAAELYGKREASERHRHRFEVNQAYREQLAKVGLQVSGTSPDGKLVEYVEMDRSLHPYFIATQAHPEFTSRPTRPNPLFRGLVRAAIDHAAKRQANGQAD